MSGGSYWRDWKRGTACRVPPGVQTTADHVTWRQSCESQRRVWQLVLTVTVRRQYSADSDVTVMPRCQCCWQCWQSGADDCSAAGHAGYRSAQTPPRLATPRHLPYTDVINVEMKIKKNVCKRWIKKRCRHLPWIQLLSLHTQSYVGCQIPKFVWLQCSSASK